MATFGKSAGAAGAITATSKVWRDLIINKARSFIYSTAPMPSQAAAANEGLKIIQEDEGNLRHKKLRDNINLLCTKLNLNIPEGAIIPIIAGEESTSIQISNKLFESGIYALSLIHISEPTRLLSISYAVFCLKKKTQLRDLEEILEPYCG